MGRRVDRPVARAKPHSRAGDPPSGLCRDLVVLLDDGGAGQGDRDAGATGARDSASGAVPGGQGVRPVPASRWRAAAGVAGLLHRCAWRGRGLAGVDAG